MKILFICGSIEPGRDGVGDYTLRLAAELIQEGHQISILAINEKQIKGPVVDQYEVGNKHINFSRLPAVLTWVERKKIIVACIKEFNPDWISLQYVPYSFNNKGLPFKLVWMLRGIQLGKKWTIMFHETWLGITILASLKHKIIGVIQKKLAQLMVKSLKAVKVSTSNRLYQLVLSNAGIYAEIIPLFSNISSFDMDFEFKQFILAKLAISEDEFDSSIVLGIFGTLHKDADLENVINEELKAAKQKDQKVIFISFGRIGNLTEFDRLKKVFEREISFLILGELPEKHVSNVLTLLSKGISCTPAEHIGKSGVYAAMRFHRLDTIVSSSTPMPEYTTEITSYNKYLSARPNTEWDVKFVAERYVDFLNK